MYSSSLRYTYTFTYTKPLKGIAVKIAILTGSALCFQFIVLMQSPVFALTSFDESNRGIIEDALSFNKNKNLWLNGSSGLFEGVVTNIQAGTKQVERRLGIGGGFGCEVPIQNNFTLRASFQSELVKKRRVDSKTPETILDQTYMVAAPSTGFTYITPAGLELYSGVNAQLLPSTTQYIEAENGKSTSEFGNVLLMSPYVGVTRRASSAAVGFFYSFEKE
jgi:hypothetical protein